MSQIKNIAISFVAILVAAIVLGVVTEARYGIALGAQAMLLAISYFIGHATGVVKGRQIAGQSTDYPTNTTPEGTDTQADLAW